MRSAEAAMLIISQKLQFTNLFLIFLDIALNISYTHVGVKMSFGYV